MVTLLVQLLIIVLVIGVAFWVVEQIPMPPPLKVIGRVIVGVIAIVVLLSFLPGLNLWR